MLNKNDPLIGAVQEVMKKNQAEREAAKIVNEAFGVEDRKALPHELQGEWDAAYKTVLTEGVEALDELKGITSNTGARAEYMLKGIGSAVRARLTGDKKTYNKRMKGLEGAKKKSEAATKKEKEGAANNETARKVLKDMGRKTGYGAIYDKMFEEEALDEKLVGNQPNIDVASSTGEKKPDGKLTKHDFEHLRSMKEATFPGAPSVKMPMKTSKHEKMYNDHHRELKSLADSGKINTPEGKKQASGLIDRIQGLVDKHLPGSPVPSKKIWLGEEGDPSKAIRGDVVTGGSSVTTVKSTPKPTSVTPADQSALKKKIQSVIKEASERQKKKPVSEGFNNRHGLSVTASAKKQAVADQLNERVVDNRQRKSRLAPVYTQGIKQTQARLAREPAEPPRSIGQKLRDVAGGAEAAITGAADRFTDFGQSAIGMRPLSDYARIAQDVTAGNVARLARGESPRGYSSSAAALDKYKRNLSQNYPTLTRAGQEAGDIASNVAAVTSVPGLVKGGVKAGAKYLARKKADDVVQSTTKLLSAPKTAKPISQAAREPANVAQAAKVAPKQTRPVSQAAREPDEIIPPKRPVPQTGNAGIRGTFQDKLARARQNAGSDLKARQLPALRRTTEPTNYVRPGLPAVRPTTSTAVARPGMPNLAAGGATRIVGLSDKAKLGLGAGTAAIGTTALSRSLNNQPQTAAAASKTSGPSFEKTGRGTAPPLSSGAEKIKTSTQTTTTQPDYDKMTFSQAFKTARQQAGGASGKFKYKGKEYQTNIQGTGTAKKPQEKYQAASKLKTVAPAPVTKTTTSVMGGQGIAAIPGGASKMKSTVSLAAKPSAMAAKSDTYQKGPDTSFNARHNYGDSKLSTSQRDVRSTSNPEKIANPTFVPQRITNRQSSELGQEITSTLASTRRVGPDGQGGLTVGQNKPMGMSFTPKTTVDTVKKPAASVTPQMSQSVSSLQQKASMAGKERGLSPNFAKTELTRRQNIQTVKGA